MLKIPKALFKKIARHCKGGYPDEVCGLLLGKSKVKEQEVLQAWPAKNLNTERAWDRYDLNPQDFLAADTQARTQDIEIIGFYHSHPDHPPIASATDTERALEGYSYLILAIKNQKLDSFKSWRLNKKRMEEEKIELWPK